MDKKELKSLVTEIWKTLKLADPPTWTDDQRLEWLYKRLQEKFEQIKKAK